MTKEEILESIQPIFHDVFDDDELVIKSQTNGDSIDEWDSLAQINLVVEMEKKFLIKFTISELLALKNVGDMIDLIFSKKS